MCGICGYIGNKEAINYLLSGIKILQNRGYDSAGICTINNNEFVINKFASEKVCAIEKLEKISDKHLNSNIGISHTRWATHGEKNDTNSHPHNDSKNLVSIVHNGIIENYYEIKQKLLKEGFNFKSETDSEVIANLISYYLSQKLNISEAIYKCQLEMKGTWGVLLLYKNEPNSIYVFKNGSPLLIGFENKYAIISSERAGFNNKIKNYITVENKNIIKLQKDKDENIRRFIFNKNNMEYLTDKIKIKKIENNELILEEPSPYNHWTIKEIYDIPMAALKAINNGGRLLDDDKVKLGGLNEYKDEILKLKCLIIMGCGSSNFAGHYGKKIMDIMNTIERIIVVDASEFNIETMNLRHYNNNEIGCLLISQSGETRDIIKNIKIFKERNIFIMSIVNVVGSQIAELSNCGVYLNSGREVGVASTKTFINQCIILLLISIWISQNKNIQKTNRVLYIKNIRNFTFNSSIIFSRYSQCKKISSLLKNQNSCFILSSGLAEIISREASLKLKELCYIHAEGYSIGSLKHGPFAMISVGTIVFYISTKYDLNYCKKINISASETKTRGARNILITDNENYNKENFTEIINIPYCGIMSPCALLIIFQIIAYELSIQKGINPDKPRNLAKSVTVE